jgi:predicted Zn-dependent protease
MKTLITFILLHSYSFAVFTLNPDTGKGFKKNSINIIISNSDCTPAGFSTVKFKDYVEDAVNDYWNSVSTSALKLNVKSIDSNYDISGLTFDQALALTPMNTILAGCNATGSTSFDGSSEPSGKSSTLGAAVMECIGKNCRSVLIINSHPTNSVQDLNRSNLLATVAHEIGHAIGLGHASSKHNLMYYAVGGKVQNWLGNDDIKGVTYLYPHEEEMSCLFGSIGSIDDTNQPPSSSLLFIMLFGFFSILLFIQMLKLFAIKMKNNFFFFINGS